MVNREKIYVCGRSISKYKGGFPHGLLDKLNTPRFKSSTQNTGKKRRKNNSTTREAW